MSIRRLVIAALAAPFLSACVDVANQTMGGRTPAGGTQFQTYVALGTSITSGFQSGGINDSVQKQGFPVLLARAMGLTPGASFAYPSFTMPGCPPPYSNILTGARVGGAAAPPCATRAVTSAAPFMNNLGVPGIRTAQVLYIDSVAFTGDTLRLSQFITGGLSPVAVMQRAQPTFVTLETGANDVLAAASRSDTTLLTPIASFQASFKAIADSIAAIPGLQGVGVATIPAWQAIPYFTRGVVFFCLKTGACPGTAATPPYSLATFTVDPSCAPSAAGGVGDSMLVTFPATGAVTNALALGKTASLNCGTGVALANAAPAGPTLVKQKLLAFLTVYNAMNAYISSQASSRGWALADLNAAYLSALGAGSIASFPDFTKPTTTIFGRNMSLDGIHTSAAGHKMIANTFITAINTKYGTSLPAVQ